MQQKETKNRKKRSLKTNNFLKETLCPVYIIAKQLKIKYINYISTWGGTVAHWCTESPE